MCYIKTFYHMDLWETLRVYHKPSSIVPFSHIFEKGNNHRCVPLSTDIVPYFNEYCNISHLDIKDEQDDFMFYTVRNGIKTQMSADDVQRFMKAYEGKSKLTKDDIPHLHPHLWRRTHAMHPYTAGVPLTLISEWLGLSNEETTRIYYARTTDEMKRQAQRKLEKNEDFVFKDNVTFKYADAEETLKKLSGLK